MRPTTSASTSKARTLVWIPGHTKGMTGPVAYWHVDNVEGRLQALLDAGAEGHQGVRDVGGGKLLSSVKDTDGNVIGLIQAL